MLSWKRQMIIWHNLCKVSRFLYTIVARKHRSQSNLLPIVDCWLAKCICKWWLTQWGRATHICVGKLTIIGSDNGLSPGRRQAIIWTNAGILLIGPLGTNFNEIFIEIHTFSFKKIHLKMSSGKWRPFCLGLNVLNVISAVKSWFWLKMPQIR